MFMKVSADSSKLYRSLVQFSTIANIPTGSTVSSATLSLYLSYETDTASRTHSVHRLTERWTDTGATWTSRDGSTNWIPTAGGTFVSDPTASVTVADGVTNVWYSWTVTSDVNAFVGGTATNNGWIVKDSASVAQTPEWQYKTEDETTASNRPKLSVTFTAPWDSYGDTGYGTPDDDFTGQTTVYLHGTGFQDVSHLVAYYDNSGDKRGSETVSASGGVLNSQYSTTSDPTAAGGAWHALVQPSAATNPFGTHTYAEITGAPDTYDLRANDSFTVPQSQIPEFPTVFAGLIAAGLSLGIYWRMRRQRVVYVRI